MLKSLTVTLKWQKHYADLFRCDVCLKWVDLTGNDRILSLLDKGKETHLCPRCHLNWLSKQKTLTGEITLSSRGEEDEKKFFEEMKKTFKCDNCGEEKPKALFKRIVRGSSVCRKCHSSHATCKNKG